MQLTEILRFTVEGKPVGKARPRFTRRGFAYTPEKNVRYEAAVRAACIEAMKAQGVHKRVGVPLAIKCEFFFEPPKSWSKKRRTEAADLAPYDQKPDGDNLLKIVKDALNGVAYDDDKRICSETATKLYSVASLADITLYEVTR